jgi:hypothetical protein
MARDSRIDPLIRRSQRAADLFRAAWPNQEYGVAEGGGGDASFLASLTDYAVLGATGTRWLYAWVEVTIAQTTDDFVPLVVSGGRFGTFTASPAINLTELNNVLAYTGYQGNSIDQSLNYPPSFRLRPVGGESHIDRNNVIVRMRPSGLPITIAGVTGTLHVFEYVNSDQGPCV